MTSHSENRELPTLSNSALLLSPCIKWAEPASRWFDESKRDPEDTVARDDGIAFHEAIHDYVERGHLQVFDSEKSHINTWLKHAKLYLDTVISPRSQVMWTELAVAVNWTSGKAEELPTVRNRKYPDYGKLWQFGTADLVCLLNTDELYVADWKTGGTDGAEEQLLSLACAIQKALMDQGLDRRKVRISCLSVNEHGVWPNEREVSDAELDAHWDAMRFMWEDVNKGGNKYSPGIHCTKLYCPHLAYCGAISQQGQVVAQGDRQMAQDASELSQDGLLRFTDTPASDAEAGFTMSLISAVKRQSKYYESKLKDYVTSGGHVVAGKWMWSDGGNGWRWRKR